MLIQATLEGLARKQSSQIKNFRVMQQTTWKDHDTLSLISIDS